MHENTHSLSLSNNEGFIMKIDIAKAYDRVEWSFLYKILLSFGISVNVVKLIMQMISTTLVVVLVNGNSSTFFKLTRALR